MNKEKRENKICLEYPPHNLGDDVHATMPNQEQTRESWEERFDKEIPDVFIGFVSDGEDERNQYLDEIGEEGIEYIKNFIKSEISIAESKAHLKGKSEAIREILELNKVIRRLISPTEIIEYAESLGLDLSANNEE